MVESPEAYPWSSFRSNALGEHNALLTSHPVYEALSEDLIERRERYRALFRFSLPEKARKDISACLSANQVLGSGRFKDEVETALGRKVGQVSRGRPPNNAESRL